MIKVTPKWVDENKPGTKISRLNSNDVSYLSIRARRFIKLGKVYRPPNTVLALRHENNYVTYIEIIKIDERNDAVIINAIMSEQIYSVSLKYVTLNLEVHKK